MPLGPMQIRSTLYSKAENKLAAIARGLSNILANSCSQFSVCEFLVVYDPFFWKFWTSIFAKIDKEEQQLQQEKRRRQRECEQETDQIHQGDQSEKEEELEDLQPKVDMGEAPEHTLR